MTQAESTNVFLITGSDEPTISNEATRLVREIAGENPDPFLLDIVRETDNTPVPEAINQVVRSALSPPFLPGRKTVWLQNFDHFDTEGSKGSQTPEASAFQALAGLITKGVPADIALVLSGPNVDHRKALFRACKAKGKLMVFDKPELRDRNWEQQMRELLVHCAEAKGIRLPDEVCSFLLAVLGTDTGRIDSELEKLICYGGGPDQPITLTAAEAVCQGQGEAVSWALSNAIGARDLQEALRVVSVAIERGKEADGTARGLLLQTVSFFRQMLQIRILMHQRRIKTPAQVQSTVQNLSEDEKGQCLADGLEVAAFNPYRAKMLAQGALAYTGPELANSLLPLRDAYWKTVSSSVPTRTILEEVLVRLVGAGTRARSSASPRRYR